MSDKYELTDETMTIGGRTLHRIKAIRNIETPCNVIIRGELGGWIESEHNLSQAGACWVSDGAAVYGNAIVKDDAYIAGHACVYGHAIIEKRSVVGDLAHVFGYATISGNAFVQGSSQIFDECLIKENSCVCGDAHCFGDAIIKGHAKVEGNAWIYGNSRISSGIITGDAAIFGWVEIFDYASPIITGNAVICGMTTIDTNCVLKNDAFIRKDSDYFFVGPIGSRDDYTTFYNTKRKGVMATTGCFEGTIGEFRKKVLYTHDDSVYYIETYLAAADLAEKIIGRK